MQIAELLLLSALGFGLGCSSGSGSGAGSGFGTVGSVGQLGQLDSWDSWGQLRIGFGFGLGIGFGIGCLSSKPVATFITQKVAELQYCNVSGRGFVPSTFVFAVSFVLIT